MSNRAKPTNLRNDRSRSVKRGMAKGDADAARIRANLNQIVGKPKGAILAALRRSPLVGVGLNLVRPRDRAARLIL